MKSNSFAKSAASLIGYAAWFGLVMWISLLSFALVAKFFTDDHTKLQFFTELVLQFVFTSALLLLPLWLVKRRSLLGAQLIAWLAVFFTSFVICIILCTIFWQNFITDKFYNCTDPGWLDFCFREIGFMDRLFTFPKFPPIVR